MDLWFISRAVGYRFGPHLADTVPILINYCTTASENDEELREYSLQVPIFESFVICYQFHQASFFINDYRPGF